MVLPQLLKCRLNNVGCVTVMCQMCLYWVFYTYVCVSLSVCVCVYFTPVCVCVCVYFTPVCVCVCVCVWVSVSHTHLTPTVRTHTSTRLPDWVGWITCLTTITIHELHVWSQCCLECSLEDWRLTEGSTQYILSDEDLFQSALQWLGNTMTFQKEANN
jgi:hypothetical protein